MAQKTEATETQGLGKRGEMFNSKILQTRYATPVRLHVPSQRWYTTFPLT